MSDRFSPADWPYEKEVKQREAIINGLQQALDENDEIGEDRDREITNIEEEKLLFFAIQEFDLPLTYSWYLAGPAARVSQTSQTFQPDAEPEVDATEARQFFANTTFFTVFGDESESGRGKEYDLRTVWYTGREEFLCDFYTKYAPESYVDLYIYVTRLRENIVELSKASDTSSSHTSLAEFGVSADPVLLEHEERELRRLVSKIHMELSSIDDLRKTRTAVTKGTDIIEKVLKQLTSTETLTTEQAEMVEDLAGFFYDYVWKYPALRISATNAYGVDRHDLETRRESKFETFESTLERRTDLVEEQCRSVGLLPKIKDHTDDVEDDVAEFVHSLTRDHIQDNE